MYAFGRLVPSGLLILGGVLMLNVPGAASAQSSSTKPVTELDRQLARIDVGVSGKGEFTSQTNGTNYLQQDVNLHPSNTLGALVTVRYTRSPLLGLEYNYGYARYTDNFTINSTSASVGGAQSSVLGVQTNVTEYTFGYVAHARRQYYGVTPFASIGGGTTAYRPTKGGGQGNASQARATYYYSVGVEMPIINEHYGLRATFRQAYENAPDYQQNYWRIHQHALVTEPAFGFYIRF